MHVTRRQAILGGLAAASTFANAKAAGIKALAFDGFPIFDPRPVQAATEAVFGDKAAAVLAVWRTRQFEYQWLRTLAGPYADFLQTTRDALDFAAKANGLDLDEEKREKLLAPYKQLSVWPDVPGSIAKLRQMGLDLAMVSNMTRGMLEGGLQAAGIRSSFKAIVSADDVKVHKPSPLVYERGARELGCPPSEVLYVAFASWDVYGAKAFGHPTFWVNRSGAQAENLSGSADAEARDLAGLVKYVSRVREPV